MKIADKTPFRSENGQIDFFGRIQGTLKYGLNWYARLSAQDAVIAVMDKILGSNFILLRNITLPDTEIDLPLVLIGPSGVFLINVIHERGVYRARDDEWGTIVGGKFVSASINHIQRTVKLGRVLQIYLDRAGYKGNLVVDSILVAAEPGMHIESVRPAVRIVMSDALERFAISLNQSRITLNAIRIGEIAQAIVMGPRKNSQPDAPEAASVPAVIASTSADMPFTPQSDASAPFSSDDLGFSFDETPDTARPTPQTQPANPRPPESAATRKTTQQAAPTQAFPNSNQQELSPLESENLVFEMSDEGTPGEDFSDQNQAAASETQEHETANQETRTQTGDGIAVNAPKKKRVLGMSMPQILILAGIFLFWICSMAGFALYIYFNL